MFCCRVELINRTKSHHSLHDTLQRGWRTPFLRKHLPLQHDARQLSHNVRAAGPCVGYHAASFRRREEAVMSTKLHPGPVYGPIHSRRLGVSLGVNLMPTSGKICTFDCLYCEDGFNAERRTREGCVSTEVYEAALEAKLREMSEAGVLPDVITFSGNGEPTAAPSFPEAVRATVRLRDQYAPGCKIAVLSNATMADRPAVREALMLVDDNILKLDTVDADFIQFLDRP